MAKFWSKSVGKCSQNSCFGWSVGLLIVTLTPRQPRIYNPAQLILTKTNPNYRIFNAMLLLFVAADLIWGFIWFILIFWPWDFSSYGQHLGQRKVRVYVESVVKMVEKCRKRLRSESGKIQDYFGWFCRLHNGWVGGWVIGIYLDFV